MSSLRWMQSPSNSSSRPGGISCKNALSAMAPFRHGGGDLAAVEGGGGGVEPDVDVGVALGV